MCRFASRCENFYPDPNSDGSCLLLCQKNPLALALALMPDRYVEKNITVDDSHKKILNMKKELPKKASRNEMLDDQYKEMVSATQELENEVIEFNFDPEKDIAEKIKRNSNNDISSLIKTVNENRNSTILDEDVSKAIEDNIQEHEAIELHPLDEIKFEPIERIAVADQPTEPHNAKVYIKTRERGRPKMSEDEKADAKIIRDAEKIEEEKLKEIEAKERSRKLAEKLKKRNEDKKKNK